MYLKTITRLISLSIIVLACVILGLSLTPMIKEAQAQTQTVALPTVKISDQIPYNVDTSEGLGMTPPPTQKSFFDNFAWQTFVALNWPSDEATSREGNPKPLNKKIGEAPENRRVWELYRLPRDVFSSSPSSQPLACLNSDDATKPDLEDRETIKLRLIEDSVKILQNVEQPLVDQQGNYVLNEIRVNNIESQQICRNQWYKVESLQQFDNDKNRFNFVCSQNGEPSDARVCTESNRDSEGAIEIKAAWRVFDTSNSTEEKARYFTSKRKFTIQPENIYPPSDSSTIAKSQELEVGLIGFHIMQKTSKNGWVWSTFEHVDNVPDSNNPPDSSSYTLYNNHCGVNCPKENHPYANIKESRWREEAPHAVTKEGKVQISSQIFPIKLRTPQLNDANDPKNENLIQLNKKWQSELRKISPSSVWQYYKLIGTQWLNPFGNLNPAMLPSFLQPGNTWLINTTLEPYKQNDSCIKCHINAKLPGGKTNADFSFLMQSEVKN